MPDRSSMKTHLRLPVAFVITILAIGSFALAEDPFPRRNTIRPSTGAGGTPVFTDRGKQTGSPAISDSRPPQSEKPLTSAISSGVFPNPFETECGKFQAFSGGLQPNPPEGPQNLRYRSNGDSSITFSWTCPNDFKVGPYGERVPVKRGSFWYFCCNCPDKTSHHTMDVADADGHPKSEITVPLQYHRVYAWMVSCKNVERGQQELLPQEFPAHPNVAQLGKPGAVMEYRYYPGTFAEAEEARRNARREHSAKTAAENDKRFEKEFAAAKDKQKFLDDWDRRMHDGRKTRRDEPAF